MKAEKRITDYLTGISLGVKEIEERGIKRNEERESELGINY